MFSGNRRGREQRGGSIEKFRFGCFRVFSLVYFSSIFIDFKLVVLCDYSMVQLKQLRGDLYCEDEQAKVL